MAMPYKQIFVVDVESTCWEEKKQHTSEIIEVGIAVVDLEKMQIIRNDSLMVKPQESTVSEYCTKLTTLTQADVDKGTTLQEACQKLISEYGTKGGPWGSWGDYDRNMFQDECNRKHAQYPFTKTHLNIKAVHAILNSLPSGLGMDGALKRERLLLEGTHHRGMDDAKNIANILLKMIHQMKMKEK